MLNPTPVEALRAIVAWSGDRDDLLTDQDRQRALARINELARRVLAGLAKTGHPYGTHESAIPIPLGRRRL